MSFEVKQGLFQLGFTDSHAILGVPLNAEFSDIRKRYTRIARRLHPDTCPFKNPEEKELAKQLLAKLVSPAYNRFSKESERKEYELLLKTLGERVVKEQRNLQVQSDIAKQLLTAANYQQTYETLLEQLAQKQFESPQKVLDVVGEISELNQVYLLRKAAKSGSTVAAPPPASEAKKAEPETPTPAPPPPPKKDSAVEQACNRAEKLMAIQNYAQAILELKDAIRQEPENSRCHGLLGLAYLGQNQPKLATPHIKRALQLNPKQPEALEAKKQLEKATVSKDKKSPQQKPGGGLFGGLFGGKKK
ncbi:J domain-containing protein [Capilliphycus salinus ALCB114379]|uniref:J domain-containing protein n=1 Tax=Capilliphycus salinus TaxID=2768948 RepID=UPI0039A40722